MCGKVFSICCHMRETMLSTTYMHRGRDPPDSILFYNILFQREGKKIRQTRMTGKHAHTHLKGDAHKKPFMRYRVLSLVQRRGGGKGGVDLYQSELIHLNVYNKARSRLVSSRVIFSSGANFDEIFRKKKIYGSICRLQTDWGRVNTASHGRRTKTCD